MPPIASFNSELTRARNERGIEHGDAADMFGVSWSEYYDLEAYHDEWFMVAPAHRLRGAIAFLRLDWEACQDWKDGLSRPADEELDALIAERREQIGLSREQMAEQVGYVAKFAEVIEGRPDGLALWPLDAAFNLAEVLELDQKSLVRRVVGLR